MKLELKHIVPYLPYGLKVYYSGMCDNDVDGVFTVMSSYYNDNGIGLISDKLDEIDLSESFFVYLDSTVKPILRPISSMTLEEINELQSVVKNKEVYIAVSKSDIWFEENVMDPNDGHMELCSIDLYNAYEWLFSNHFDVFGLINKDLAINKDKNKIK